MQTASPDWVVKQIDQVRTNIQNYFVSGKNKKGNSAKQFLLMIFIGIGYAYAYSLYRNTLWTGLSRHSDKIYVVYPLFAGLGMLFSFLFYFLKKESVALLSLFYLLVLLCLSLDINFYFHYVIFLTLIFIFSTTVAFFYLVRKLSARMQLLFCLLYAVLIFNFTNYLSTEWTSFALLKGLLFQRYIFVFLLAVLDRSNDNENRLHLFLKSLIFPGQGLYPLPTQPYYWEFDALQKEKNRITGLFDLLICSVFTILLFELENWYLSVYQAGPIWIVSSLVEYLGIYLFSCVSISTPVAVGRLLGYSLPSPYQMPLLAASPQARWRRWNTYFYNFYCWILYFPILKKTQSVFFALFTTFLVTALFHSREGNPLNYFSWDNPLNFFNSTFIFFLAHGLVVYGALIFQSRFWDGRLKVGWFGVALTWIAMLMVHLVKLNDWGI